jgi:hypothetical protein
VAKKDKKVGAKKQQTASAPVISQSLKPDKDFTLIITGIYFLIALLGIFHHEMWRDEYQAWLIVINAHSFSELYTNCIYEGAPMLWHILLYVFSWLSKDIIMMKIVHVLIATGSVFLINRFSNFSLIVKLLFTFGYYSLFEYSMIARCYSLGFFLVLLFCALYKNRQKNILWLGLTLFGLANTSAYGFIISLCLSGMLFLDFIFNRKKNEWAGISFPLLGAGALIFITGAYLAVLQIMPEADNNTQSNLSVLEDGGRMKIIFSKIYTAYFLFPEFKNLPNWNTTGMMGVNPDALGANNFISFLILFITSLLLIRKPLSLLLYWSGTMGLILLYGLTFLTAPRYTGHLIAVFIASLWLADYFHEIQTRNSLIRKLSELRKKYQNVYLIIIFASQTIVGVAFYFADFSKPFSNSMNAAKYIKEQKLDTLTIIGATDYAVSGFTYLLDKPLYYPERKEYGTFIIWDGKRKVDMDFNKIIQAMDTLLQTRSQALVILNYQPSYMQGNQRMMLEHVQLTPTIQLDIQNKFEKCMVADEVYYIYIAKRIKQV